MITLGCKARVGKLCSRPGSKIFGALRPHRLWCVLYIALFFNTPFQGRLSDCAEMVVAEPLLASPGFEGPSLTYRHLQATSHHSVQSLKLRQHTRTSALSFALLWTHFIFSDVTDSTLYCYCFLFEQPLKIFKDTFKN